MTTMTAAAAQPGMSDKVIQEISLAEREVNGLSSVWATQSHLPYAAIDLTVAYRQNLDRT